MGLTPASSTNYDIHTMDNVIGYYIYDIEEAEVAEIRDLLIDAQTRKPRYVVIEIGGLMSIRGRRILIPWNALQRGGMSRLDINTAMENIMVAPTPLEQMEPTRVEEESIHHFFNVEPYWIDEETLPTSGSGDSSVVKPGPLEEITEKLELEKDEQEKED